jgi:glycosidase
MFTKTNLEASRSIVLKLHFTIYLSALKMKLKQQKAASRLLVIAAILSLPWNLASQAIFRMEPPFPAPDDSVTIYLDASQSSLAGVTGNIYAHTGLTINGNNWRNVVGNWGTNDGKGQMQRTAADKYQLKVAPSIREWYASNSGQSIASNADISKICIIFRNADGSKKAGEGVSDADIFLNLSNGQFSAAITSHTQKNMLLFEGEQVIFTGQASENAQLSFSLNGEEVSAHPDTNRIDFGLLSDTLSSGMYTLIFTAFDGTSTIRDTVLLTRHAAPVIAAVPDGRAEGISYPDSSRAYLQLRAPGKEFVYILGDFNDWMFLPIHQMKKTPDGNFFWVELTGLDPSKEYRFQYYVGKEGLRVADPYCEKVLDPWNDNFITNSTYPDLIDYPAGKADGIAGVLKTVPDLYTWDQTYTYSKPPREDLIIYELHIRDFTAERTFKSVIDRLDYFTSLGVNAIEFMPLAEFEGNDSWGYNPSFFSAVDKAYGPATEFKRLVDSCHRRGIAVLVDVVFNHAFGQSPFARLYFKDGKPTSDNPWLNTDARHDFNVGYDFNHEREATRYFVGKTLRHWIREYKIDGYRFDLSKGFTQKNTLGNVGAWGAYDQARINILKGYADSSRKEDPSSILILEHFGDWSEEKVLAQYGFIMWAKGTDQYNQNTMGFSSNSNLFDLTINRRGWQTGQGPERYGIVSFMESHDEERLMVKNRQFGNRNDTYNTRELKTALDRVAMAACFFIPLPSAKMIWQFGELGYDFSINYCPNGTINPNCRTGVKPLRWNYYADQDRRKLFDVFRKLNYLKRTYPVFRDLNVHMELNGFKKILRFRSDQLDAVIAGNFNITGEQISPGFPYGGKWYDYLTGDSITVADPFAARSFAPGEYHVYLNKRVLPPDNTFMPLVSIDDQEELVNQPDVFPNPFRDEVYIRLPMRHHIRKADVSIFDLSGKMVFSGIYSPDDTGTVLIGTGSLSPGAYLVTLRSEKGLYFNGKLLKQ